MTDFKKLFERTYIGKHAVLQILAMTASIWLRMRAASSTASI